MPLTPPVETEYPSYASAKKDILNHARGEGYGVAEKWSKKDKKTGEIRKVWIHCDKSGKPRAFGAIRKTSTRKTDCPFELTVTRTPLQDWTVQVIQGAHNHEASSITAQHPCHQKRTGLEKAAIKSLTASNADTKHIWLNIREQNPDSAVLAQDIQNERATLRREALNGDTPIVALGKMLEKDDDWAYSIAYNHETKAVNRLFFAHAAAIALARTWPEVLLVDATYWTNYYNLPLLHFLGRLPTGKNFTVAFCFISDENERMFSWALRMLKASVYGPIKQSVLLTDHDQELEKSLLVIHPLVPHLLYVWHVEKNVLEHAQKIWRVNGLNDEEQEVNTALQDEFMVRWKELVYTRSEGDFVACWDRLNRDYHDQPHLLNYLLRHKWRYREMFVKPWTSKVRHFGMTTTSPVNDNINSQIIPRAVQLLIHQYELSNSPNTQCSRSFEQIYGIPCQHTLKNLITRGTIITASHFNHY